MPLRAELRVVRAPRQPRVSKSLNKKHPGNDGYGVLFYWFISNRDGLAGLLEKQFALIGREFVGPHVGLQRIGEALKVG